MDEKTLCRSVFKNGKNNTTPQQVTQLWVTLINQTERSNAIIARGR